MKQFRLLLLLQQLFFHPPGGLGLRVGAPKAAAVFSANLRQTLLIQLVQQQQQSSAEELQRHNGISQLDKRATAEPSNGIRRSMGSRKSHHHQNHQHTHNQQQCERLTERQKYARLEAVGGRNQQFQANSPREAAHNFGSLLPQMAPISLGDEPPVEDPMLFLRQNDDPQQLDDDFGMVGARFCGQRCREIKAKLEHALGDTADWDWADRLEDGPSDEGLVGPEGVGGHASNSLSRRGGCHLERFVPIGNCTEHGFEEAQGSEKLCTACQGIFLLNKNCFPLFVNSVVCGRHELECIYDRMSGSAQGKCRPKMLSFKVMFNRGTPECERWGFEFLEVPVACECYLSKRSVWLEAVPPPSVSEEH